MNIVMVGHKYVPSRDGGIEIVVEELSSRFANLGHQVTILNRKRKGYKKFEEYKGCKIKEIFTINKKSLDAIIYSFFATLKIRKLIKKGKIDIVHYHAEGPCVFLNLLPKGKKRKGTKIVVTIHGLDWQRGKWNGFASRIIKVGEKKAVKYANEIIVLSQNNQQYFKQKYGRETNFIPNGVSEAKFHEPEIIKEKYGLIKNDYVLFLARIVPEKGLEYLLKAWEFVKNSTDKKLVIAGGDSNSKKYYESIKNRVEKDPSIIMTGFVSGQELQELYSNAYLYVLPSDIEGMPMSLLEALSYGNICLVSNILENTEIINDDCFVFNKSDVEDLEKQLKKALLSNLQSHKNIYQTYNWNDIVERTLELYKK